MDQLTKSKESSSFYRCAPLVVALCLVMVAGCCSTNNRPKFLQRLQNREEVDSRLNDSKKDSPSNSSDPLKEKETVESKSLTAGADSGDRSQYVDNAGAAKDASDAGVAAGQAINLPYRSYAPSADQASQTPTLLKPEIPDPTPLSTQGTPQADQTGEASQTQAAPEPQPEPAPAAQEQPTPAPEPQPQTSQPESSVPQPPVVSEPEPAASEPQPSTPESSVPTPPTTFEHASVETQQPIASEPAPAEPEQPAATEQDVTEPQPSEQAGPAPTGLQGDSTVGDLAKEATDAAENVENAETPASAESAPNETPTPASEAAPEDSTDDSNWEQKYSANKTGRNVQLKNAVYSRVRSGNAKAGTVRMKSAAQQVEVPKTASVVVERVAPIVPVASNGVSSTEEYVDASKYRGRRRR
ncbi:MAG: hypothetical protein IJM54_11920 [Thermoguttaceae bacterium]|nr:hypothetical protein [Thermoguttaceae bacterium]